MMATIFEAKTRFSELLKLAQSGEEVIITSGRAKVPVAEIKPIEPLKFKRLGVCYNPKFVLPTDFFEPDLDEEASLTDPAA